MVMLPTFRFGSTTTCTYCSDPADCLEHVIPVAYNLPSRRHAKSLGGPLTHSCHPCNTILGSKGFSSFLGRCEAIAERLGRTAKPVLWTNQEIAELGHSLKVMVEHERNRRLWLRTRADWYQSREFWLNLEPLTWEPILNPLNVRFHKDLHSYFESTVAMLKAVIY